MIFLFFLRINKMTSLWTLNATRQLLFLKQWGPCCRLLQRALPPIDDTHDKRWRTSFACTHTHTAAPQLRSVDSLRSPAPVFLRGFIYLSLHYITRRSALETRTSTRRVGAPEPGKSRQCEREQTPRSARLCFRGVGTPWYCLHCMTECGLNQGNVIFFFFWSFF